jgi:hypothetical protein
MHNKHSITIYKEKRDDLAAVMSEENPYNLKAK